MSRLSNPTRDSLDAEGQQIWDRLSGPRKGMHGPYLMLMHVPQLADHVAQLGAYLRFSGCLNGAIRECAILCTARALGVPFEWVMHEAIAEKVGLSSQIIELVREGKFDSLTGAQKLIGEIACEIVESRHLSDSLFQQGLSMFGEQQLVELVTLINFYTMIGGVINCFEVSLPDGSVDPFGQK